MDNNNKLKNLNLYNNKILYINNVNEFKYMENLDLSDNKIRTINNIDKLLLKIGRLGDVRCSLKLSSEHQKYSKYNDSDFQHNLYIDFNADHFYKKYEIRKQKILLKRAKIHKKRNLNLHPYINLNDTKEINFGY
jgi:hypothetical protein